MSGVPEIERPAEFAVPARKLTHYLLDPTSKKGGPKAEWFMKHAFRREAPGTLEAVLLEHAATQPIPEETPTPYGVQYVMRCHIPLPDGAVRCIRSVWQVPERGGPAAFITAFVLGL